MKGGKNPGNLVPGKNKWIKSKKQPRSFELDVGGLEGLAKTKDVSGGSIGSGKSINGAQLDRRRGDTVGNEGRSFGNGNGKGRDTRSNGQTQGQGQGQGSRSQGPQGQGARFGMKKEATGPGAGNRDRNFDRQSGPSSTPRKLKNNKESASPNGISSTETIDANAEADTEEPVVVEEDESIARKNRFGPPKSGSSSGSSSQGKTDKKSKSRTSFHKLSTSGFTGELGYPVQPGSHSHGNSNSHSNPNPKQKNHKDKDNNDKKTAKKDKVEKFKVEREVYIPPISVKVGDLARMVDVRLGVLQARMRRMGMGEEECHSDNCEFCGGRSLFCLVLYLVRRSGAGVQGQCRERCERMVKVESS